VSITAEDAAKELELDGLGEYAALVRSLEQVRVVTEAFKENPTLRTWAPVREAIDAHRKEFGS